MQAAAGDGAPVAYDARGGWLTPGLVDAHTHLVYAGDRAHEFEMRLEGASYEDVARAGGGILSTVRATRAADEAALAAAASRRLERLLAEVSDVSAQLVVTALEPRNKALASLSEGHRFHVEHGSVTRLL